MTRSGFVIKIWKSLDKNWPEKIDLNIGQHLIECSGTYFNFSLKKVTVVSLYFSLNIFMHLTGK